MIQCIVSISKLQQNLLYWSVSYNTMHGIDKQVENQHILLISYNIILISSDTMYHIDQLDYNVFHQKVMIMYLWGFISVENWSNFNMIKEKEGKIQLFFWWIDEILEFFYNLSGILKITRCFDPLSQPHPTAHTLLNSSGK